MWNKKNKEFHLLWPVLEMDSICSFHPPITYSLSLVKQTISFWECHLTIRLWGLGGEHLPPLRFSCFKAEAWLQLSQSAPFSWATEFGSVNINPWNVQPLWMRLLLSKQVAKLWGVNWDASSSLLHTWPSEPTRGEVGAGLGEAWGEDRFLTIWWESRGDRNYSSPGFLSGYWVLPLPWLFCLGWDSASCKESPKLSPTLTTVLWEPSHLGVKYLLWLLLTGTIPWELTESISTFRQATSISFYF